MCVLSRHGGAGYGLRVWLARCRVEARTSSECNAGDVFAAPSLWRGISRRTLLVDSERTARVLKSSFWDACSACGPGSVGKYFAQALSTTVSKRLATLSVRLVYSSGRAGNITGICAHGNSSSSFFHPPSGLLLKNMRGVDFVFVWLLYCLYSRSLRCLQPTFAHAKLQQLDASNLRRSSSTPGLCWHTSLVLTSTPCR